MKRKITLLKIVKWSLALRGLGGYTSYRSIDVLLNARCTLCMIMHCVYLAGNHQGAEGLSSVVSIEIWGT